MNLKKRQKCQELNIRLQNNQISLDKENSKINEKELLRKQASEELDDLYREKNKILLFGVIDATGSVIITKNIVKSGSSVLKIVADFNDITDQISKKTSEITYMLQDIQEVVKRRDMIQTKINDINRRLSQIGCR